MSDPFSEKPKNDTLIVLEKPKGLPRLGVDMFTIVIIITLTCVLVLGGFALLGPAIGNVYSSMLIDL